MLVTEEFVFVHVPKTGGSFTRGILRKQSKVIDEFHKHAPYSDLPIEYRELPVVSVIRNPWDWYVSWYHFAVGQIRKRGPRPQGGLWKGAGDLVRGVEFEEALTRACDFRDGDLYSYGVRTTIPLDHPRLTLLRFEDLRNELIDYTHDDLHDLIRSRPASKASEHAPYRDYYSPRLRKLVRRRCAWLCEEFGYRF
jgi:hypothetical protein